MPDTVIAVLTALGVGGIIGGWLATRRERAETFRGHMVSACVSFLEKAAEARSALEDASIGGNPERAGRLTTAEDKVRTFETQSGVLNLFFPPNPRVSVRWRLAEFFFRARNRLRYRLGKLIPRKPAIATRAEMQWATGLMGLYRSGVPAADSAQEVVQLYWKWYDQIDRDTPVQTEELERVKSDAERAYRQFCFLAHYAIRGRTF
jgi:hypothetical protein